MNRGFWLSLAGTAALLVSALSSCASTPASSGGGNTNQGTTTSGPVSIGTNHTTYMPTDVIEVTVANDLPSSIFAYDTRAGCSILGLQMQTNGDWQDTQIARCSLGRPAMVVEIQAGKVYSAKISAGSPGISSATFPPGTYHLWLSYATSAAQLTQPVNSNMTTIYSATFTVSGST